MTKRKPNDVVEVRISLQDKLSQQMDTLIAAESAKDFADAIDKLTSFENFFLFLILFELIVAGTNQIIKGRTPTSVIGMMGWLLEWLSSKDGGREIGWREIVEIWAEWFTLPGVISKL